MFDSEYLTVKEVAEKLRVTPATIQKWIRDGEIEALDLGRRTGYRIDREEFDRFVAARKAKPEENTDDQ